MLHMHEKLISAQHEKRITEHDNKLYNLFIM